jgi:hypothetical protein
VQGSRDEGIERMIFLREMAGICLQICDQRIPEDGAPAGEDEHGATAGQDMAPGPAVGYTPCVEPRSVELRESVLPSRVHTAYHSAG